MSNIIEDAMDAVRDFVGEIMDIALGVVYSFIQGIAISAILNSLSSINIVFSVLLVVITAVGIVSWMFSILGWGIKQTVGWYIGTAFVVGSGILGPVESVLNIAVPIVIIVTRYYFQIED